MHIIWTLNGNYYLLGLFYHALRLLPLEQAFLAQPLRASSAKPAFISSCNLKLYSSAWNGGETLDLSSQNFEFRPQLVSWALTTQLSSNRQSNTIFGHSSPIDWCYWFFHRSANSTSCKRASLVRCCIFRRHSNAILFSLHFNHSRLWQFEVTDSQRRPRLTCLPGDSDMFTLVSLLRIYIDRLGKMIISFKTVVLPQKQPRTSTLNLHATHPWECPWISRIMPHMHSWVWRDMWKRRQMQSLSGSKYCITEPRFHNANLPKFLLETHRNSLVAISRWLSYEVTSTDAALSHSRWSELTSKSFYFSFQPLLCVSPGISSYFISIWLQDRDDMFLAFFWGSWCSP